MRQTVINQYEKVGSNDINSAQLLIYKSLFDDTFYTMFGGENGVIGTSFQASYVSALAASLNLGCGFFYDNTQVFPNPEYRMILAPGSIPVTFTAASTQDRIDLVCLAPNYVVTSTALRYVKSGGTGPITQQTVNKLMSDSYTLQVVAGTPGGSPSAPSCPSGYIPICQAYIHANTGMGGSGDITDERYILGIAAIVASAVPAANTNHVIATGTTTQAQLDELDNADFKVAAFNPAVASPYSLSTSVLTGDCGKCFLVNSANGASTFDLPAPVTNFWFKIKDIADSLDSNPVTMHRYGSELFEGLASDYIMQAPSGEWMVFSDGTNWYLGR